MSDKKQYQQRFEEYKQIAAEYYDKIPELEKQAENSVVRTEYSKGGEVIHRGYYCPSPVQDKVIGNNNRGRLLKRTPENYFTYSYGFDADDRLILVTQTTEFDYSIKEVIVYQGDCVTSVEYAYPFGELEINGVSTCCYENGKLKLYEHASVNCSSDELLANIGEIQTEEYEYNGDLISTCLMTNWSCGLGNTFYRCDKYDFNYDKNGEIISYTLKELECDSDKDLKDFLNENELPL